MTTSRKTENDHTIKINLMDQEKVFKMLQRVKPDYILHLSGQNDVQKSWLDPLSTLHANVFVTVNLLEAVRQFHPEAKAVVVGSVLEEDGMSASPMHPYGLSKQLQAMVAKRWADYYALRIVIAKPVNLIGPGFSNGVCAKFAKRIVHMEERNEPGQLTISSREIERDFLDVRDAVSAYELLLSAGENGKTYDVGTGKWRTLLEIADTYRQLAKVPVKLAVRNNQAEEPKPCINPVPIRSLGWRPQYSLTESLTDCINFYRKIGGDNVG